MEGGEEEGEKEGRVAARGATSAVELDQGKGSRVLHHVDEDPRAWPDKPGTERCRKEEEGRKREETPR